MTATTPGRLADAWLAPPAAAAVQGRIAMPGSKSATNRALLLAALAPGTSELVGPLQARDTLLMAEALRRLGADVAPGNADPTGWSVTGQTEPADANAVSIDCGNAGTVARFLPPAAAVLAHGPVTFQGDPRMHERPLAPLLDALRQLGARMPASASRIPFTLDASGCLPGGELEVDASSSSQLISGLLLPAARYEKGVRVTAAGGRVPSAPHLAMTVALLRQAGAVVDVDLDARVNGSWSVQPGPLTPTTFVIEPDLSSASAFLAAAAVTAGTVQLANWPAATEQPGRLLPELLAAFGCTCTFVDGDLRVAGPDRLNGVDLDLSDYGESVPTLTAMAALASSPSRLRGIAHLRGQETDRLAALAEELGKLGARIDVTADGLAITPVRLAAPRGVVLDPRGDHRLAMAYAVVGLVVAGVRIRDIATTSKTFPDFVERWSQLLDGAS